MNNISVIVRNRLGQTYGNRLIDVDEDGQETYPVISGSDKLLPDYDQNLQSIVIEAHDPQNEDFRGNGTPIPITIDSPQNYVISTLHHEAENRWRIEFEAPQRSLESTERVEPDPPPVNITIGHDDPGWSTEKYMIKPNHAFFLAGGTGVITLGLSQFSTILGGLAPLVLVLAGIIFSFKQWKENKKKA